MHITLIRKYKLPSECTYVCLEYPSYTGFAKRALWGRSSIVLYHNEQENLSMSQKNLSDIIKYFPLRFLGLNCAPYYMYEYKEGEIGYSKQSLFVPKYVFHIAQTSMSCGDTQKENIPLQKMESKLRSLRWKMKGGLALILQSRMVS